MLGNYVLELKGLVRISQNNILIQHFEGEKKGLELFKIVPQKVDNYYELMLFRVCSIVRVSFQILHFLKGTNVNGSEELTGKTNSIAEKLLMLHCGTLEIELQCQYFKPLNHTVFSKKILSFEKNQQLLKLYLRYSGG